jgi:type IV secretion system protein VirD4
MSRLARLPLWAKALAASAVGLAAWTVIASAVFLLGSHLWEQFGWPERLWAWWVYVPYWRHPTVLPWLEISAAGGVFPVLCAMVRLLFLHPFGRARQKPLYGDTQPANEPQMQEAGLTLKRRL